MIRMLVAACALLFAACGGGNGPGPSLGVTGPPSAQTVAANDATITVVDVPPVITSASNTTFLRRLGRS